MVLYREKISRRITHPRHRAIEQRRVALESLIQRFAINNKAMVLAGDFSTTRLMVTHRVMRGVVSSGHLCWTRAKSRCQHLMTKAYPKQRDFCGQ